VYGHLVACRVWLFEQRGSDIWKVHGLLGWCQRHAQFAELFPGLKVVHRCCLPLSGYDFLNSEEVTSGKFMAAGGYKTAHFGKVGPTTWHVLLLLVTLQHALTCSRHWTVLFDITVHHNTSNYRTLQYITLLM
jgi:hypothetical protein